ncbi:MAG: SCO family protein [Mangrovicoccus sp.]|nr:SCO family protein [Mangrovicoccus sp.]
MSRLYAMLAGLAVALLLGISLFLAFGPRDADRFAQCRSTSIAGGAGDIGGPFELVDSSGATRRPEDVITGPTLIYFGYTYCPDVCPLDTARNAEAVDLLDARGVDVTPVFISIDPQRDTPEVIGDFASNLHEKMIGLTGTPEQVKAASQAYRTYYQVRKDGEDDEYYLVDHSTFSYLAFPGDGVVEIFRRELSPEMMADQISCFVENY